MGGAETGLESYLENCFSILGSGGVEARIQLDVTWVTVLEQTRSYVLGVGGAEARLRIISWVIICKYRES